MNEKRSEKNYGVLALMPILAFLVIYVGCGLVFRAMGVSGPFNVMPRYTALMIAILIALFLYERKKPLSEKADIYCANAGRPGVMQLGLIVLLAGGFASSGAAMGGRDAIVNLGVTLIPGHFLAPGIFLISAVVSTCIGTSMGTLTAMLPVAFALAEGTGLDMGMAAAAAITGSFFGDNLSMISDTTICATQGVGADMKDKFRMNFLIALPAAVLTMVLCGVFSSNGSVAQAAEAGSYQIVTIIPYIAVLGLAVAGLDVIAVLALGMILSGAIGMMVGTCGFFEWAQAVSSGMEGMFWLVVFFTMVSGVVGMMRYYGGIDWLIGKATNLIKSRRSCEYVIGLMSLLISSTIVNNTLTIMITAPIAKELGEKYHIAPKRLASLLDIGACVAIMIVPYGTALMMAQEGAGCDYIDVLKYEFYPFLLLLCTAITMQFGLMRTKEEKAQIKAEKQADK